MSGSISTRVTVSPHSTSTAHTLWSSPSLWRGSCCFGRHAACRLARLPVLVLALVALAVVALTVVVVPRVVLGAVVHQLGADGLAADLALGVFMARSSVTGPLALCSSWPPAWWSSRACRPCGRGRPGVAVGGRGGVTVLRHDVGGLRSSRHRLGHLGLADSPYWPMARCW